MSSLSDLIVPLPVFEADADPGKRDALSDREIYDRLESPSTMVVRFGRMYLIGEYKYDGDAKPGCGTRLVARTHRGTELVEMLTTTCENGGCGKSIQRKELLGYIENSGGRDFPFFKNGRVLRVATVEDLNAQSALDSVRAEAVEACKREIVELGLEMKLVEAEPILGGELLTFYYMAEKRVDFRELVRVLAAQFKTRIEMRQVGARDEARITADYERCGQHCCCKSFLKVLKPVSMKSAKIQKATLDPLKISGRCGRLMCCLRYEDQTYAELKKTLPRRQTRVGTPEGPGVVIDGKILVQLVLVRLEHDAKEIAIAVEDLMDPDECPPPGTVPAGLIEPDPLRGLPAEEAAARGDDASGGGTKRRRRRRRTKSEQQDAYRDRSQREAAGQAPEPGDAAAPEAPRPKGRGRGGRKRGRRGKGAAGAAGAGGGTGPAGAEQARGPAGTVGPAGAAPGEEGSKPKRKRRRRRRRGGGGGGEGGGGGSGDGGGGES